MLPAEELFEIHIAERLSGAEGPIPGKRVLFVIFGTGGGIWTVDFESKRTHRGEVGAPDLTVRMADDDLQRLLSGEVSGGDLFESGRLELSGEIGCAELLEQVFVRS